MPRDQKARTRKARSRKREKPELTYQQALEQVDAEHAARERGIDPQLLYPYPDEEGVVTEELGWRALPADATPQQRARAEAVWRPVRSDRPCRCSGQCHHGAACDEEYVEGPCGGRLIHVDRYPGSMFSAAVWEDVYKCDDCGAEAVGSATLPEVPWAELRTEPTAAGETKTVTVMYEGLTHPAFAGWDEPCEGCGEVDFCRCPEPWDGCPECGAGGSGDPYGECECVPGPDEPDEPGVSYEEAL